METSTLLIIAVAVAVAAIVALVVTALMASSEKYRLIRAYEAEKDEKDAEIGSLNAQKAKLEATINERYEAEQRREADRKEQYQKDLEAMKDTFKALSAENSAAFKRESSSSIEEILKPFKERFDAFDKSVRESDEKALERTTRLTTSIEEVLKHSRMVGDEAKNLANALTGYSKVQGNFGEMLLADLLKNSGLVEGQHFFTQSVMTDEAGHEIKSDTGGTMIPDVLVCYPDDTTVVTKNLRPSTMRPNIRSPTFITRTMVATSREGKNPCNTMPMPVVPPMMMPLGMMKAATKKASRLFPTTRQAMVASVIWRRSRIGMCNLLRCVAADNNWHKSESNHE